MWIGLVMLFIGQLLGSGALTVLVKIGLSEFSPFVLSSIRFIVAAICIFLLFRKRNKLSVTDKRLRGIFKKSIFFAGNIAFFSIGLQFTTAIMSQIIYLSVPIIVVIIAHFVLDEKITKLKLLGFLIVFSGLFLLFRQSFNTSLHGTFGTPLGNAIILLACCMWSLYVIMSRRAAVIESTVRTTFGNFFFTAVVMSILIPLPVHAGGSLISHVTWFGLGSIVLLGVGTVVQYIAMQYGIKHISATTVSFFQYLAPVFAALFAIPILHEKVTSDLLFASLLILAGVFVVTTYPLLRKEMSS